MKNFFIKHFSFCVMIFFFTILVACSGNKKTIDSNTKKDIIESEEDKTTVFNSTTSSLNQQTIKTDYEKYLSQETDFEGEEFIEDSSEFQPLIDFFENVNIPMGCKVCIVNETEIYDFPKENSPKINFFKNNELVTVAMITEPERKNGDYNTEKDYNEFWVKIVSKQYKTGWTMAGNLKMVSENPNSTTITPKWSHFGAYGSAFSPDGKYICLKNWGAHNGTTGTLRIFNVESGELLVKYDAAYGYDQDSSEHVVFSKDSKLVYFEEDLILKSINVQTNEIVSYSSPTSEYGDISNLLLDQKGERILYIFSSSNAELKAAVYNIEERYWHTVYSYSEAENLKTEFNGFETPKLDLGMRYFQFAYGDYYRVLPDKNLLLCTADGRRHDERHFKGIYFFELSTGRFLKAENPFVNMDTPVYVDAIDINADRTKIAIRTEGEDPRVTNASYYICDISLPDMTVTIPRGADINETLAREEQDMFYLTNRNFYIRNYNNEYKGRITFFEDNTFSAVNGPNGDPGYGTYKIIYNPEWNNSKIYFDNITCYYDSMVNYYNDCLNVGSYGWIDREASDFYTKGGITYSDDDKRFVECNEETEPYKIYNFNGQDVIKYPQYGDSIQIYIDANLKMRDAPSVEADVLEFPFNGYLNNEYVHMDSRSVVFEGQKFYVIASSTEKDTIDGITDYWYLIRVSEDDLDDFGEAETHLVWIFGGYTHKYENSYK